MYKRLWMIVALVVLAFSSQLLYVEPVEAQALPDWCLEYDFTVDDGDWFETFTIWTPQAEYIPGVGWSSIPLNQFQYTEIGTSIRVPSAFAPATYTNIEMTFSRNGESLVGGTPERPDSEYWWEIWGQTGLAGTVHTTIAGDKGIAASGDNIVRSWVGERTMASFILATVAAEGPLVFPRTYYESFAGETVIKHVKLQGVGTSPTGSSNCTPTVPGEQEPIPGPGSQYDWCYKFDFVTNDHEVVALYGDWLSGTGWVSELVNQQTLLMQYARSTPITPLLVQWQIDRGALTGSTPIDIQARFQAFGTDTGNVSFTMSAEEEYKLISLTPALAGLSSAAFDLSLVASQVVSASSLTVYGNGISPFPFNLCGAPTPTPQPSTATAAPTGTATPVPTQGACLLPGQPSPTPTTGPSPTPTWYTLTDDFNGSLSGATQDISNEGGWSGGSMSLDSSNAAFGQPIPGLKSNSWFSPSGINTVIMFDRYTFPQNVYVRRVAFEMRFDNMGSPAGFGGFRVGNVSTRYLTSPNYFASGGYEYTWISFDQTFTPVTTDMIIIDAQQRRINSSSKIHIDNVIIEWAYVTPPSTPYPSCTSTPTITPSVSPTMTPSRTPTQTPTQLTITPTFTRTPTRTPFVVIIPTTASTSTPRPPTATAHPSMTAPASPTVILPSSSGTPSPGTGGIGQPRPFDLVGDISYSWENINAVTGNIWAKGRGWATGFADRAGNLAGSWTGASPTAPPQMWNCISNPFESQWCAILYFLQFTILSGTIGSLIVPVGTALIFLFGAFVFVRIFRAFLARTQEMLNV